MVHYLLVIRINIFVISMLKDTNTPKAMREDVRAISSRYTCLLIALENLKKIKAK